MGIHGPVCSTGHLEIELERLWCQRGEIKSRPNHRNLQRRAPSTGQRSKRGPSILTAIRGHPNKSCPRPRLLGTHTVSGGGRNNCPTPVASQACCRYLCCDLQKAALQATAGASTNESPPRGPRLLTSRINPLQVIASSGCRHTVPVRASAGPVSPTGNSSPPWTGVPTGRPRASRKASLFGVTGLDGQAGPGSDRAR